MNSDSQQISPLTGLSRFFILIGIFIISLNIIQVLVFGLLSLVYQLSYEELFTIIQAPENSSHRVIHLIFQGAIALGSFGLTALFFIGLIERKNIAILNKNPKIKAIEYLWVSCLFIGVMPFSSLLIDWNAQLEFPAFMSEFEQWARQKELGLAKLTNFLIQSQNTAELLLGLLALAIIPGIGEELVFRGLLQRNLSYFINPHIAIWITAMVFSAIHLQFFGFFPRMFLGLLLGYVYFWSGNLYLSIWGHILNNGFTLLWVFLYQRGVLPYNLMRTEAMPIYLIIPSIILSTAILYYFWQKYKKYQVSLHEKEI